MVCFACFRRLPDFNVLNWIFPDRLVQKRFSKVDTFFGTARFDRQVADSKCLQTISKLLIGNFVPVGNRRHFFPVFFKEKCNISSLLYTTKWYLQCYLDAVNTVFQRFQKNNCNCEFFIFVIKLPFSLVLRIWDIFLLKGDDILLSMSYCILKTHKSMQAPVVDDPIWRIKWNFLTSRTH